MGKGRKPHCATEFTSRDEETLWKCGELGTHSAYSLLNTVWLIVQELFVLKRAKFDVRESCLWGDVTLGTDISGAEYLELHGMETKSITGEIFGVEEIRPRAWANPVNPARCPVEIFKLFRQKRHPSSLLPMSPFFVAISKGREEYWYQNKRVGHNTLSSMLGEMGRRANLPGKKSLTSLQKTDPRLIPFFATFQA